MFTNIFNSLNQKEESDGKKGSKNILSNEEVKDEFQIKIEEKLNKKFLKKKTLKIKEEDIIASVRLLNK